MLLPAIVLITTALVLYTIGVWAERIQKVLKWWHVVFFALGLMADASGTYLMTLIADSEPSDATGVGAVLLAVMGVTGVIAILLMAVHLAWAIVVLVRGREREKHTFHRFSVVVWAIWLVPYLTGAIGANLS